MKPVPGWQHFEWCGNCGRVVDVRDKDGDGCRACTDGWRLR